MKIGFTGTRERLQTPQIQALFYLMERQFPFELHHGDCVGADSEANAIFTSLRLGTKAKMVHHPTFGSLRAHCVTEPQDEVREPKAALIRNQDIVDETDCLIACPRGFEEEQRSGTWSTVRRARRANKSITYVWPDGTVTDNYTFTQNGNQDRHRQSEAATSF